MKKVLLLVVLLTGMVLVQGCINMPTRPNQISAIYVSPLKYENYTCEQLSTELNSLSRRKGALVAAQSQRVKTSKIQAFLYGYGQGDGIEASELAAVWGEYEAVRKTMEAKKCN